MNDGSSKSIVTKIGIAILVIALIDLLYLNYWVANRSNVEISDREISEVQLSLDTSPSPTTQPSPTPSPNDITQTTKTIVEKEIQTVMQNAQKEIFIPIGSGTISDNDWTTIPGLEVVIDTTKYTGIETIVFSATLWPEGGNGTAHARLINITDTNPYIESEISSSSSVASSHISGNIPMANGSKKYGIQAKSDIENFAAHVENARIKITLK